MTHNIEEAVTLADRILVFGANPGHVRVELPGSARAPSASVKGPARAHLVETIYQIMTNPDQDAARPGRAADARGAGAGGRACHTRARRVDTRPCRT